MPDEEGFANWQIRAPKELDTRLQTACDRIVFSTKAEFIRQAVRERLEKLGVMPSV